MYWVQILFNIYAFWIIDTVKRNIIHLVEYDYVLLW